MNSPSRPSERTAYSVLDSVDAAIYVVDMSTHEILFANRYLCDRFGDVVGQPCWQALQAGQAGPCAFCTDDRLVDEHGEPAGVCSWEFQNTVNGRWYEIRDRAIRWADGRLARLEVAIDITERKGAEERTRWEYQAQSALNALLRLSLEDISLDRLLQRALDLVLAIPWLAIESSGGIFVVGEDPEAMALRAQRGLSESQQRQCAQLALGRCLCGQAALTQEVQFADGLDDRHQIRYEGITPHGHYCIPIVAAGRSLGVINLYVKVGHRRDEREEAFLTAVAHALAGIILRWQAEEELRRSSDEAARGQRLLLALSRAAQAVQRARSPDQVYQAIGEAVVRLGYQAAILTRETDAGQLVVSHLTFELGALRAAERLVGLSVQDVRLAVRPGGSCHRILAKGSAAFFGDVMALLSDSLPELGTPLLVQTAALLGIEQAICAPLQAGGDAHGLLVVAGAGLQEADVPAVSAFANQAAIAIENARLYVAERAARMELRDLTSHLQTAREEERARVAREIHDELGQALTALKIDLSWLAKRLPGHLPGLVEKARSMSALIDEAIQDVRRVATSLRPRLLDDLGLPAAIEWQAQEFAARTGIDCRLDLADRELVRDRDLATALFRIYQETLTNVARHAEATRVRVCLVEEPEAVVLSIMDDGIGITERELASPASLGLIGMRERALAWGGEVTVESASGQGTTVTVRIPRVGGREGDDDPGAGSG
jgi:signal transduction histidine kinase